MGRKALGTIKRIAANAKTGEPAHWAVRISLIDGARPWIHLDPRITSEARAREAAAAHTERARLEKRTAADFGLVTQAVREAAAAAPTPAMSVWFDTWIASRKARGLTNTRENASHWAQHLSAVVKGRHVRDWTTDDLRAISRDLDAKVQAGAMKWKTAWNVWATASRMCRDAATSKHDALRVRADNPARDVAGPDRGADTVKQYLYPSEFARFVSCPDVPLVWRRGVAVAVYIYARAGELRVLEWNAVDLEHGTVHVHQAHDRETGETKTTKSRHARRFSVEPHLLPLLHAMHAESGGEGLVCPMPSERDMARGLRRWLLRAGVDRAELHTDAPTRKKLTFHDLRATGITWMAIRGDDPLRIQQRAGHEDFATTQVYIREAESVREGFGTVFPSLPPELSRGVGARPPSVSFPAIASRAIVPSALETFIYAKSRADSGGADGTRIAPETSKSPTNTTESSDVDPPCIRVETIPNPAEIGAPEPGRPNAPEPRQAFSAPAEWLALAEAVVSLLAAGLVDAARPLAMRLRDDLRAAVDAPTVVPLHAARARRGGQGGSSAAS